MNRVHFVGGEKGGVGKTVLARLLCHELLQQGRDFVSVDADTSQSTLSRAFASTAVDLTRFGSADLIMERALTKDGDVVVDLPAHSHRALSCWFEASDVLALAKEHAIRFVFWYVTDGGYPSVSFLGQMGAWLTDSTELLVVRNQRWSDDFSRLEAANVWAELEERGARSVDLPSLDPALMFELERSGGHFRSTRRENATDPAWEKSAELTPMQLRRLTRWLALVHDLLSPLLALGEHIAAPGDAEQMLNGKNELAVTHPARLKEGSSTSTSQRPPIGTKWIDGATTWTEVADNALIHHVRCP